MKVLVITTVFNCLAALFVAIRLWTRLRLVKNPGYDDLLISLALLSSFAFYAFVCVERNYGLGVHKSELSDSVTREQLHYLWLSVPFYNLSLVLSKLSALFLFTRIFRYRTFLLATRIVMGILIISGLWMVTSGFVFCLPISDFWNLDLAVRKESCLPQGPVWYSNAGIQILTDVVILILPMPLLSSLHLPRQQKAGIMIVFGLGIFVIATSSARLYELSTMIGRRDFTKTNAEAAVWSSLEANVSIICACLPPIHPLLSRVFSFFFRPQPLHSSPASKNHSHTTHLTSTHPTSSRKPSIYDHTIGHDRGVFYNDVFFSGPGSYSASVAKMNTSEEEAEEADHNEDGIMVVRELRQVSDSMVPSLSMVTGTMQDREIEMGQRSSGGSGKKSSDTAIEWDLGDFEFPDYKERMNAPI